MDGHNAQCSGRQPVSLKHPVLRANLAKYHLQLLMSFGAYLGNVLDCTHIAGWLNVHRIQLIVMWRFTIDEGGKPRGGDAPSLADMALQYGPDWDNTMKAQL